MASEDELLRLLRAVQVGDEADALADNDSLASVLGWPVAAVAACLQEPRNAPWCGGYAAERHQRRGSPTSSSRYKAGDFSTSLQGRTRFGEAVSDAVLRPGEELDVGRREREASLRPTAQGGGEATL